MEVLIKKVAETQSLGSFKENSDNDILKPFAIKHVVKDDGLWSSMSLCSKATVCFQHLIMFILFKNNFLSDASDNLASLAKNLSVEDHPVVMIFRN